MKKLTEYPRPVSASERYQVAMIERLDMLIEILNPNVEEMVELKEEKPLPNQVTIEEVIPQKELTEDEKRLQELLQRRDYETMKKDELLVVLAHRECTDASKYMLKPELVELAKKSCPDKEG